MSNPIRYSTDITDRGPPSPAPTYRSTFHTSKDHFSLSPNPTSSSWSPSSGESHTSPPYTPDAKSPYHPDEKKSHTTNNEKVIELLEEPFDTNHPHYTPPSQSPPLPALSPPPRKPSRLPSLKILIPWILFAIFFLLTAWYTSIALGIRLFTHLHPSQPLQITINNDVATVADAQPGSTKLLPLPLITPSATLSPTSKPFVPGNGVDLGSNTVTSRVVEAKGTVTSTATVGFGERGVDFWRDGDGEGRGGGVGRGWVTVTVKDR